MSRLRTLETYAETCRSVSSRKTTARLSRSARRSIEWWPWVSANTSATRITGRSLKSQNVRSNLEAFFRSKDYREAVSERAPFDRVVAVGLCEHIGYKNYRTFLEIAERALKPGGLFLLHTIGSNESYTSTDAWVDKYIFPNGMVPSLAQLGKAMEGLWVAEDWHNFGPDYDKTLLAWWSNFSRAWPSLRSRYSDRFYRMWKFYLMGSAGRFRARKLQLWQFVLSKGDIPNYVPVR